MNFTIRWVRAVAIGVALAAMTANANAGEQPPTRGKGANQIVAPLAAPITTEAIDRAVWQVTDALKVDIEKNEREVADLKAQLLAVVAAGLADKDDPDKTQREKDDLEAQQDMAFWAKWMVFATAIQVIAGLITLSFLFVTLRETRITAKAAVDAASAAHRQADASILLDAAKLVVEHVYLSSPSGDHRSEGIPPNGYHIGVALRNIGKTTAFMIKSEIALAVAAHPPEYLDRTFTKEHEPGTVINAGYEEITRWVEASVALPDKEQLEIDGGQKHLWVIGRVVFEDWFGVLRTTEFTYRWKCRPDEGQSYRKAGFVAHNLEHDVGLA